MLLSLESHKSKRVGTGIESFITSLVLPSGLYKREGLVSHEFGMWLFWVWKVRSPFPFLVCSIFFAFRSQSWSSRWQSFSRREKLRANSVGKDMVVMVLCGRWVGGCSSWPTGETSTSSTFHSPENWAYRGVTKYAFKEITFSFSFLGDHP